MVQRQILNLTFHGIGEPGRELEPGEDRVWISRERFLSVLDAAAGRPDVRLTFDDGNASDVRHALPALRERGLTATFFVVAGRLDDDGFLSTADVRELAAAGMTIGSHGMTHRPWRRLDAAAAEEELVRAGRVLAAVAGRPVVHAACPFGAYDRRSLHALRRGGYAVVYTSDRGTTAAGAWLQARNSLGPDDDGGSLRTIAPPAPLRRVKLAAKRWR